MDEYNDDDGSLIFLIFIIGAIAILYNLIY